MVKDRDFNDFQALVTDSEIFLCFEVVFVTQSERSIQECQFEMKWLYPQVSIDILQG